MTELEVPVSADADRAESLVREFLDVGDVVEVHDEEVTKAGSGPVHAEGEVTGFEHGYLELDGEGLDGASVRYDEIHTIKRVS